MFIKTLIVGALGYLGYRTFRKGSGTKANAAFSEDQPHRNHLDVRDAGPGAMRDKTNRPWTETDEDLDESFPASDPPGGY